MTEYRIPAVNLAALRADVSKMNKRAKRLGADPVVLTIVRDDLVTVIDPATKTPYVRTVHVVDVTGSAPRLAGWRFVAKVEPVAGNLNVVKELPGESAPDWARTVGTICQHCNTNRTRNEVFIVGHDDGRTMVVGRNCLGDFLGGMSPERLARLAEFDLDLDAMLDGAGGDGYGCAPGGRMAVDVDLFLTMVAAVSRVAGFVSSTEARNDGGVATGFRVWWLLQSSKERRDFEDRYPDFAVTDDDRALAAAARDWALNLAGDSTFDHNMKVAAGQPVLDERHLGIVAYVIGGYRRHLEREITRAAKAAAPASVSRHVGTIKQRITFDATVTFIREMESYYGLSTIHKFVDADGNVFTWFYSGGALADQGDRVRVVGTVKQHETYRDEAQTILTRCRLDVIEPADGAGAQDGAPAEPGVLVVA